MISRYLMLSSLLIGISACNYNNVTDGGRAGERPVTQADLQQLDFALIQRAVIGPKCLSCHANATGNQGGTNLESYKAVRSLLNRVVYRSLEKKDMPPGGGLAGDQAKLLSAWAEVGAPETVAGPSTKPDPGLDQGSNDWTKVRMKIFEKRCQDCHSGEIPQGALDITSLPQVKAKAAAIFDRVFIKQDMPMAPYPALGPRERRVLLQWFDSGMPE